MLRTERVARDRWRELLAELTSLTGAGMGSLSDVLATAEKRGYFTAARFGAGAVDRIVASLDATPATPAPSTLALLRRLRDPQVRPRPRPSPGPPRRPRRRRHREGLSTMPVTTLNGKAVHVNEEGFLTEFDEWDEDLAAGAGRADRHRADRRALEGDPLPARGLQGPGRDGDHPPRAEVGGFPIKEQFALFPKKPGKKMAYIAGLPKPHGCV